MSVPSASPVSRVTILARRSLFVLWSGCLAGMVVGATIVIRYYLRTYQSVGLQSFWLAPLAGAGLMLPVAVVLGLVGWWLPPALGWRLTVGVAASLAAVQLLLLVPGLHSVAVLLLAVGAGVRTAAWLDSRERPAAGLASRTLLPLLICTLVAGSAFQLQRSRAEAARMEALPPAPDGAPNVLLIILDTVREKSLSLYGHEPNTTPHLIEFARSGTLFRNAYTSASWTAPAHASLFTGRLASQVAAGWPMTLTLEDSTLAQVLAARGFATTAFVANFRTVSPVNQLDRGFIHFDGYPLTLAEAWLSTSLAWRIMHSPRFRWVMGHGLDSRKSARQVNARFFDWLDDRPDRPFFAFLNYFDAHSPYGPPAPFDTLFGPTDTREVELDQLATSWPAEELDRQRRAYEGSIAGLDRDLGELFAGLAARHLLDNTLVIVTSDHGEQFGEKGYVGHGNSLYPAVLQVPLVIRWPEVVPEGATDDEPVSLEDIPATIMGLAAPGEDSPFRGVPIALSWHGTGVRGPAFDVRVAEMENVPAVPLLAPGVREAVVAAVSKRWLYILNADRSEELYDLEQSREPTDNVVTRPELGDTLALLRQAAGRSPRKKPALAGREVPGPGG